MNSNYWLGVAAYLVPTFPLGYVWHLKTFKAQYDRLEMFRSEVVIPLGLTSMILQALLFAWLYPHLFNTDADAWMGSAARFGLIFGTLAWSFTTLPVAAKYRTSSVRGFLALETSFTVVHFAVVSPLIALAFRGA
jgi:hypothetical protein